MNPRWQPLVKFFVGPHPERHTYVRIMEMVGSRSEKPYLIIEWSLN